MDCLSLQNGRNHNKFCRSESDTCHWKIVEKQTYLIYCSRETHFVLRLGLSAEVDGATGTSSFCCWVIKDVNVAVFGADIFVDDLPVYLITVTYTLDSASWHRKCKHLINRCTARCVKGHVTRYCLHKLISTPISRHCRVKSVLIYFVSHKCEHANPLYNQYIEMCDMILHLKGQNKFNIQIAW